MTTRSTGISVGCNAGVHAVAWSSAGLIAFAANRVVAVYDPTSSFGVQATLKGHTARVTVVRWIDDATIVSGSADATVRIWKRKTGVVREDDGEDEQNSWHCRQILADHTKSISCLAVCGGVLASGAMDGNINLYQLEAEKDASLLQTLSFKPSLPLGLALSILPGTNTSFVLAVGGTCTSIFIYSSPASKQPHTENFLEFKVKLPGHEDWTRSFDFLVDGPTLLLASASQDRYIRLWRFEQRLDQRQSGILEGALDSLILLENKAHDFLVPAGPWKVSFEALLVSHEDWVFSVEFSRDEDGSPILLSSSADSSVIIWYPDTESQIWTVQAQLGVISTKGASTATGSTGGFWGAIFSPKSIQSPMICAWNKTGSLRLWSKEAGQDGAWRNIGGVGGHVKEVRSLSWSPNGEYFLTTSLDQSTRLWAKHKDDTWKEFARPQIHGYDIQSIHVMSPTMFVSGAEEKIVRVFQATSSVVDLLARVAGIDFRHESTAEAANVPALGLSNKALTSTDQGTHLDRADLEESMDKDTMPISKAMLDTLQTPPTEDHLQRHTLFPELEKLYGHGYEIQALSASHDDKLIVSGCRATTPEHAVLRLYDASDYKELLVLEGHTLTATRARFSDDDRYLLSVSRDRSFCLYSRSEDGPLFRLRQKIPKAHKRIIWDCAWLQNDTFATASRDGTAAVWTITAEDVVRKASFDFGVAATAIAWSPRKRDASPYEPPLLAVGLEDGSIRICQVNLTETSQITIFSSVSDCDGAITGIGFRPQSTPSQVLEIAYCSEDCSVRVLQVQRPST